MKATWIEMPAIPLQRGVPVVSDHAGHAVVVWTGTDGRVILSDPHAIDKAPGSAAGWRVDLDDPQGFGYALRWLGKQRGILNGDLLTLAERWIVGDTTDTDRITLAKACAEVTP